MGDQPTWDTTREWSGRWTRWLVNAVTDDWRAERISRDFIAKLQDRHIARQQVWAAITSPESYIGRYWHNGNRVGFWHPRSRLFVAWKPNHISSPGRLMSAFFVPNGVDYLNRQIAFREIRGPRR